MFVRAFKSTVNPEETTAPFASVTVPPLFVALVSSEKVRSTLVGGVVTVAPGAGTAVLRLAWAEADNGVRHAPIVRHRAISTRKRNDRIRAPLCVVNGVGSGRRSNAIAVKYMRETRGNAPHGGGRKGLHLHYLRELVRFGSDVSPRLAVPMRTSWSCDDSYDGGRGRTGDASPGIRCHDRSIPVRRAILHPPSRDRVRHSPLFLGNRS